MMFLGEVMMREFMARALQFGLVAHGIIKDSVPATSNMTAVGDARTAIYPDEENANLTPEIEERILEDIQVNSVHSQGTIDMIRVHADEASANGRITAVGSMLRTVTSERGSISLDACSFSHVQAGTSITAIDCHVAGFLQADESISVSRCSRFSAQVSSSHGRLTVSSCKEVGRLQMDSGFVDVTKSSIDTLQGSGRANVNQSEINVFEFSGSITISNSKVRNLIMHPLPNEIRVRGNNHEQAYTVLTLTNTEVGNVEFVGYRGKITLRGTSKVGSVINGEISPSLENASAERP